MASTAPILLDVLSDESYLAEHLPGAINFSVYEVAFSDKVRAAIPDPATPIKLYGFSDATAEAETASAKLRDAGYLNVTILAGGLEEWKRSGGVTEGEGSRHSPRDGVFEIDISASFIRWTGSNVMNFHHGRLALESGEVTLEDGNLTGGRIVIAMDSLSCADITDAEMNAVLIHHLRSEDFFAVDRFPRAIFTITSSRAIAATRGQPSHIISGELTLRGISHPLEFPAAVGETPDGGYSALAFPAIDRTVWGSIYGSGGFFSRIGMHLVNDFIHLHLHLFARPRK